MRPGNMKATLPAWRLLDFQMTENFSLCYFLIYCLCVFCGFFNNFSIWKYKYSISKLSFVCPETTSIKLSQICCLISEMPFSMTFEKEGGLEVFENLPSNRRVISDRSTSFYLSASTSYSDMYNHNPIFPKLLVRKISDTVCLKARRFYLSG